MNISIRPYTYSQFFVNIEKLDNQNRKKAFFTYLISRTWPLME